MKDSTRATLIALALMGPLSEAKPSVIPLAIEPGRDDAGQTEIHLAWESEPGLRYGLYHSEDLRHWNLVPGFPEEAATEAGQHPFSPESDRGFFQAAELGPDPQGFAWIAGGTYLRGDSREYAELYMEPSRPAREVTVSGFFLARAPVTYTEWREVYDWAVANGYDFHNPGERGWRTGEGPLPAGSGGERHPVVEIGWHDAVKWCNACSEREGLTPAYYTDEAHGTVYRQGETDLTAVHVNWTANGYRLPTEAEWEKAARGGLEVELWPWGSARLDGVRGNFAGSRLERGTTPVGDYPANAYGLYDLVGNVWEWCWDRYAEDWYSDDASVQPDTRGPEESGDSSFLHNNPRILRGGSWTNVPGFAYVSMRHWSDASPSSHARSWGFRVVRGGNE